MLGVFAQAIFAKFGRRGEHNGSSEYRALRVLPGPFGRHVNGDYNTGLVRRWPISSKMAKKNVGRLRRSWASSANRVAVERTMDPLNTALLTARCP
jgi:hypothetical protein